MENIFALVHNYYYYGENILKEKRKEKEKKIYAKKGENV